MRAEALATAPIAAASTATSDVHLTRFRRLATTAAFFAYGLIVVGGIVRITGSGLGCGDDWPRCHGEWIPPFTLATVIEYTHRLLALGLSVLVVAIFAYALKHRRTQGFAGPGHLVRIASLAVVLLVIQVLLGAITVILKLPASTTVLHLGTAMALLATFTVASMRAGGFGAARVMADAPIDARAAAKLKRAALAAAILGLIVVLMGALTANTAAPVTGGPSAAALACQGFPLCNGQIVPAGNSLVHIHWTHRLLAFLLFFHVLGATISSWQRNAPARVSRAATVALALIIAQLAIAALMVLFFLPPEARALHLLVGTGLWMALVVWAARTRRVRTVV
jgi:cytochrome c oxidase assembly protein subunit 15